MIVCGLLIDTFMVTQFMMFIFIKQNTWRFFLGMIGVYGLRIIVQNTFLMEKPTGYIWEYPGFPSLVVPYGATNDFFFSGHVAGQVISILEF